MQFWDKSLKSHIMTQKRNISAIPWSMVQQLQQSRLGNRYSPVVQQAGVVGEMKGIPDEGDSSVRRARNTE